MEKERNNDKWQKMSLELILPDYLKTQITDSVDVFIEGISMSRGKKVKYKFYPGSVMVENSVVLDDDFKFSIIKDAIEKYYGIPFTTLITKNRRRYLVEKRQMMMVFALKYTRLTTEEVGGRIGGKDHSTVTYARKTIIALIANDGRIKEEYEAINEIIAARIEAVQ